MKKSPKRVIKNKYFYIKIPNLYGDMEIYPSNKSIRSYNKQLLKTLNEDFDSCKTLKEGHVEYY